MDCHKRFLARCFVFIYFKFIFILPGVRLWKALGLQIVSYLILLVRVQFYQNRRVSFGERWVVVDSLYVLVSSYVFSSEGSSLPNVRRPKHFYVISTSGGGIQVILV